MRTDRHPEALGPRVFFCHVGGVIRTTFLCLNYELSATSHIRFIADAGSSRDFNQGTPVVADAGQWPAIAAINSKNNL